MRNLPRRGDSKKEKENIVAIKISFVRYLVDLYEYSPPRTVNSLSSMFLIFA